MGESLQIEKLVGLYWEYRDLREEGRLSPAWSAEILAAIIDASKERLAVAAA